MSKFLCRKNNSQSPPLFSVSAIICHILFLIIADISLANANTEEGKVHIVYMGKRPHDDPELITSSHHDMLAHVLGSTKQESAASMVYSCRHGFSGFAAKLTKSQAQTIA
ncbi:hypothetical protein ACH5RR_017302, partial [Cinchona calisaya]